MNLAGFDRAVGARRGRAPESDLGSLTPDDTARARCRTLSEELRAGANMQPAIAVLHANWAVLRDPVERAARPHLAAVADAFRDRIAQDAAQDAAAYGAVLAYLAGGSEGQLPAWAPNPREQAVEAVRADLAGTLRRPSGIGLLGEDPRFGQDMMAWETHWSGPQPPDLDRFFPDKLGREAAEEWVINELCDDPEALERVTGGAESGTMGEVSWRMVFKEGRLDKLDEGEREYIREHGHPSAKLHKWIATLAAGEAATIPF